MYSDTLQQARPLTLRNATAADLPGVLALLAETADWLNGRGIRQWPAGGFPAARIEPLIAEGTLYVVDDGRGTGAADGRGANGAGMVPAATLALDDHADPEFWTPADRPDSALYVHKLAVGRAFSGQGLGETLLDWAALRVAATGRRWLRLDCAKHNRALQAYYSGHGFRHVRTVDLPHRASGALFERPADVHEHTGSRSREHAVSLRSMARSYSGAA
ncbi:GNAT family N-acetyltransferase [Sphaerisporangium sp. TRM90804]|uniref:GNAT family N-acetyltransferase n=1 Tax=Sphaerisporangium sp. TRM90804 TaxID=3031113 RepID=UPI00244B5918|nr:GNAT family N-acetyltransferase [Sphaerisporangium sp. TRM90804]MDH2425212.1 GNAT family N-acetyltransferase [Sphaerisporangium sp. TRM90804]